MPRLILCADDFGLSRPISETIAALAAAGKLNATSVMAGCPGWLEDAPLLRDLPCIFQVGIHLTLTGEPPLTNMPVLAPEGQLPAINTLQRLAGRRELPLAEIRAEIAAQFERFEAGLGRAPDFVDGHQHCHVLPGIREIVLEEATTRAPEAWLRDSSDGVVAMLARPWRLKAIGSTLHAHGVRRDAARYGVPCNDSFAGHYSFSGSADDYAALFPSFLRQPGTTHVVMCHPGAGHLSGDDIAEARIAEAAALRAMPIVDIAAAHGLAFQA